MANFKIESKNFRVPEIEKQKKPVDPLTDDEKAYLTKNYMEDFCKEYEYFVHKYNCAYDLERSNKTKERDYNGDVLFNLDVRQDGAIFFLTSCLVSFDKDKFKDQISDKNIQGAKNKKTLDFFFNNYCRFLLQCHMKDTKKKIVKNKQYQETHSDSSMFEKESDELNDDDFESYAFETVSDIYGGNDFTLEDLFSDKVFAHKELNLLKEEIKHDVKLAKFLILKKFRGLSARQLSIELGEEARSLDRRLKKLLKDIEETTADA